MLRTHRNLEAYCATLWWRWSVFSFFRVMEHRWNENDRGKQKYSGEKMHQCHFVHQKSHMDLPGIFFFFFTNSWVFPFDPFLSCINPFSSFRVSNGPQPSFYNTTQTSMPPVGFEPTIPVSERPKTHALDRAATGIGIEPEPQRWEAGD